MFCRNCGIEVPNNTIVCPNCGEHLSNESRSGATVATRSFKIKKRARGFCQSADEYQCTNTEFNLTLFTGIIIGLALGIYVLSLSASEIDANIFAKIFAYALFLIILIYICIKGVSAFVIGWKYSKSYETKLAALGSVGFVLMFIILQIYFKFVYRFFGAYNIGFSIFKTEAIRRIKLIHN